MSGRVLWWALLVALWAGALPAAAQEVPSEPPAPPADAGLAVVLPLAEGGSIRFGKDQVGTCGETSYYAPYGKGIGLLQPGKALHYVLEARVFGAGFGQLSLCGTATTGGVPEIGTAGACDGLEGLDGQGVLDLGLFFDRRPALSVSGVRWPATGGLMAVTATLDPAEGQQPGSMVLLVQRRSHGNCVDKRGGPGIGTVYPYGSTGAELVGVLAYQLPRDPVGNTVCEERWGQVRRHLRGAGAGIECPVPAEL